jgi:hypothetical protein
MENDREALRNRIMEAVGEDLEGYRLHGVSIVELKKSTSRFQTADKTLCEACRGTGYVSKG